MDPQTADSIDHEPDGESDQKGLPMTKKLRIWLISIFVALAVPHFGVIVFGVMVAGEEICLDRHPWWGPPSSGYDDSCSGHMYQGRHPESP